MTAETKIPTAVLRAAMNAEFCGVTMRDALMAGTDHDYEVLEASLRAALAALTEAKQQGPGEALKVVERKIKWREQEIASINAVELKVSTHMEHIRIHEACLRDLYDVKAACTAPQVEAKRQTGEGE